MTRLPHSRLVGGFTLIELLCVIAIIGILAALLLPAVSQAGARAKRTACVNNLQETGVAFHAFAHDHASSFPMQVPVRDGGSQEFALSSSRAPGELSFAFRHFQPLASELVAPKILICPSDTRQRAANFAALGNENVSYFVAVNAEFGKTTSILAGDRNITNDWLEGRSVLRLDANNYVRWTHELHRFKGNLLFADGHVELSRGAALMVSANGSLSAADLVLPSARSEAFRNNPEASNDGGLRTLSAPPTRGVAHGSAVAPAGSGPTANALPPSSPAPPTARPTTNGTSHSTNSLIQAPATPPQSEMAMSAFDQQLKKSLQHAFKWGYLLLLFLLAAVAAFELWRRARKKNKRGGRRVVVKVIGPGRPSVSNSRRETFLHWPGGQR